jgi:hypothetical protein
MALPTGGSVRVRAEKATDGRVVAHVSAPNGVDAVTR